MTQRPGKKDLPKLPPAEPVDPWSGSGEEASGGTLEPSPELAEALREAAEAIPDRSARKPAAEAADPSADSVRIEDLSAELVETKDRLIRLHADFENYRRRAQREREEAVRYGTQNLFKDLLTTVDNLERAIDHARMGGGADLENLLQGVELVQKGLVGLMSTYGVEEIDALGKLFDPALHEAMAQAPDASQPANTVLEVLQKGYKLRDRLLRPARVIIARPPDAAAEGSEGQATDS